MQRRLQKNMQMIQSSLTYKVYLRAVQKDHLERARVHTTTVLRNNLMYLRSWLSEVKTLERFDFPNISGKNTLDVIYNYGSIKRYNKHIKNIFLLKSGVDSRLWLKDQIIKTECLLQEHLNGSLDNPLVFAPYRFRCGKIYYTVDASYPPSNNGRDVWNIFPAACDSLVSIPKEYALKQIELINFDEAKSFVSRFNITIDEKRLRSLFEYNDAFIQVCFLPQAL